MNKTLRFSLKAQEFIATNLLQNDLYCNIKPVERVILEDSVFAVATTPFHKSILNFYDHFDSNTEPLYNLERIISLCQLPENLLLKLVELYMELHGNTIICTIYGPKIYTFQPKKYSSFSEMISNIKYFWGKLFSDEVLSFCRKNSIDLRKLRIEITLQRWNEPVGFCNVATTESGEYEFSANGKFNVMNLKEKLHTLNEDEIVQADFFEDKNGEICCYRYTRNSKKRSSKASFITLCKDKEFARIAVIGIVFSGNKFLLLKQNDRLKLWRPPCGGVHRGENCTTALIRETKEDCGLDINVIMPVNIWKSAHGIDDTVLSISYICEAMTTNVKLSPEYLDFIWTNDLEKIKEQTTFDMSEWMSYLDLAKHIQSNKLLWKKAS